MHRSLPFRHVRHRVPLKRQGASSVRCRRSGNGLGIAIWNGAKRAQRGQRHRCRRQPRPLGQAQIGRRPCIRARRSGGEHAFVREHFTVGCAGESRCWTEYRGIPSARLRRLSIFRQTSMFHLVADVIQDSQVNSVNDRIGPQAPVVRRPKAVLIPRGPFETCVSIR